MPGHYVIQSALNHDYEMFFNSEITYRKELDYPPFTRLCRVIFENKDKEELEKECLELEKALNRLTGSSVTAFFQTFEKTPRRADFYRAFLLLKSRETGDLRRTVLLIKKRSRKMRSRFLADMDPVYLGL
jgi:primosomal protein N' (replication factor Y)